MKKAWIILLVLALALLGCAAIAEGGAAAENAPWYELSAEDTVLTVRLPGNSKSGLSWFFEISNPDALELLTQETIEGESEGMAGTPTTYVASFMSTAGAENSVSLILRCAASEADAAEYTRVLEINTAADNSLSIASELAQAPFADWCEYGDDGYILTARMPDADWGFEITDPDRIELITCDSSDGAFVASFMSTMNETGDAEIVFKSDDGLHYRTVTVFVNESGKIFVDWVEDFNILQNAPLVYCELCGGWYEEGNIFRNHVCAPEEESLPEGSFYTVKITGNSVNMRSMPGVDSEAITVLKKGAQAKYLNRSAEDEGGMEWLHIEYDGNYGWVSARYAEIGGQGYVKIVDGDSNLRSAAGLDASVLGVVKKGATITYLGEGYTDARGVDWYLVRSNGTEGWVSSRYARFTASAGTPAKPGTENKYVQIQGGNCNMRKAPNLDAASVTVLKNGATGDYLGEESVDARGVAWYKASFNGKTGWVSSKYARLVKNGSTNTGSSDKREEYNPRRYDVLQVNDIYSQNGRDIYVEGCFGRINSAGEPEYFDRRESVVLKLVPGAEVLLPSDPSDFEDIDYVDDPAIWFNDARNYAGGSYSFYAGFSMNESGELRSLVFRPVY